jgi:hypothetical protein
MDSGNVVFPLVWGKVHVPLLILEKWGAKIFAFSNHFFTE